MEETKIRQKTSQLLHREILLKKASVKSIPTVKIGFPDEKEKRNMCSENGLFPSRTFDFHSSTQSRTFTRGSLSKELNSKKSLLFNSKNNLPRSVTRESKSRHEGYFMSMKNKRKTVEDPTIYFKTFDSSKI